MIEQREYVMRTIKDLVSYAGDVLVFETFIEIWGLKEVYDTAGQIIAQLEIEDEEVLQSDDGIDTDGGACEAESGGAD